MRHVITSKQEQLSVERDELRLRIAGDHLGMVLLMLLLLLGRLLLLRLLLWWRLWCLLRATRGSHLEQASQKGKPDVVCVCGLNAA